MIKKSATETEDVKYQEHLTMEKVKTLENQNERRVMLEELRQQFASEI